MKTFINFGERRINLNSIKEYKPLNVKDQFYQIKISYMDGTSEELGFGHNKENRDEFLSFLDKNFLKELE